MKRKKTIKESNFLKSLFKTGDKRNSAKKAYNLGSKTKGKTNKKKINSTADTIGQKVATKLQDEIDKYYKKQDIDIDWVLKRLTYKADHSKNEIVQVKCIELVGKNKKAFTERIDVEVDLKNLKVVFSNIDFKEKG